MLLGKKNEVLVDRVTTVETENENLRNRVEFVEVEMESSRIGFPSS